VETGFRKRSRSSKERYFFRRDARGGSCAAGAADPPDGFCTQKPRLPLAICCKHSCELAYQQCRLPSLSMMHHGASPPAARPGGAPPHRPAARIAIPSKALGTDDVPSRLIIRQEHRGAVFFRKRWRK
jgi:hypothetical protein